VNPTVSAIVGRLPKKPLVSPQEIADAFSLTTPQTVIGDIAAGLLAAVKVGNRYLVARDEAIRYVSSKAVVPDEAVLPKPQSNKPKTKHQ